MADIIFDFDGTIADSLEVISDIFYQLNGKTRKLSKEEVAEFRGLPILAVAERIGIPAWKIPFLLTKGRLQMGKHMGELHTFAGIKPLIKGLHGDGHRLFILSSNSSANVRKFLRAQKLDTDFTHVYGNVGLFSKPSALKRLIKRNFLKTDNCFYICDEGRDIEAAKEAGVRAIAVVWGFAEFKHLAGLKPYALAQQPAEIADIIKSAI